MEEIQTIQEVEMEYNNTVESLNKDYEKYSQTNTVGLTTFMNITKNSIKSKNEKLNSLRPILDKHYKWI